MAQAWSRCLTGPRPDGEAEPCSSDLPFTATLRYESALPGAGVRHLGSDTFEGLAEAVTSEVTVAAILERAGELTMLHACGVADQNGAVIALVAKSGTGKTTASSQLARTFGYITDETVAIRPDGTVVPYPKPLSVKQATPGAAKLQVGPDELGLKPRAGQSPHHVHRAAGQGCRRGVPVASHRAGPTGGRSAGADSGHFLPGCRGPAAAVPLPAGRQRGRGVPS